MLIKILVVGDSASEISILGDMLKEYCLFTAYDGREAISILESNEGINLLIVDLDMPNMDGLQFLDSIKKDERFRNIRTIILTKHDDLESEIKGLRLGAVDYIRKPFQIESLKTRIAVHIALLYAERASEKLDESLFNFYMIFNQAPIGIAIVHGSAPDRSDEVVERINSMYEKITGRTREEINTFGTTKVIHPEDLVEDMKNFRKLLSGEIKTYSIDIRYIKPDGSIIWVHKIVASLTAANNRKYRHILLVQDITEQKAIEEALHESERSKSVILSHLPGLAYRCNYDRDWTMQYVSDGCYNLTGYPPERLLYNRDLSYNDIISPEYREALWQEWKHAVTEKQPFKYEYEIITATGEKKWVLEIGQAIYDVYGEVVALEGIVLDISDRKAIENALKYNSEHDRLTGLYNRDYLESLLKKDLKTKKNIKKALIGINLSTVQLLAVNYGFQYSQNLIKNVAETLNQHSNDNRILFRTRENHFVFYVLGYKDKEELINFSTVLVETLEPLFAIERIGGGIGILEIDYGDNSGDINLLLRRLLIASERSMTMFGKDFKISVYDEELEALANRERDIIEALKMIAIDDNTNNNLFVQYQPIMDLKTDSIIAFEALARLKTEKFGMVSPAEFIPIAEKTKLILPIGEKVIVKALGFLKKLEENGYDGISVSINISIIQLLSPDFLKRFFQVIEETGVNKRNIGIEITESVFASDYDSINKIVQQLRKEGIYVAIDDFGIGYSSLSRVKELKADCIKIDKYFVDKLSTSELENALTGGIISMAHKLGHYTIAEGVEKDTQLQYLIQHNCDKIQGYLISKPLDEGDALQFLKSHGKNITANF